MRILLDECVPASLRQSLPDHHCQTVQKAGLSGKENGELLNIAEELGYDVLLTVDQNLPYQQRIHNRRISIVILTAESNQIRHLLPLMPACLKALQATQPGQVVRI
jgi:predicted nuclease of predicted toxin-antitoxin system